MALADGPQCQHEWNSLTESALALQLFRSQQGGQTPADLPSYAAFDGYNLARCGAQRIQVVRPCLHHLAALR